MDAKLFDDATAIVESFTKKDRELMDSLKQSFSAPIAPTDFTPITARLRNPVPPGHSMPDQLSRIRSDIEEMKADIKEIKAAILAR